MRWVAAALSLWSVSTLADELPSNLLCEGTVSAVYGTNGFDERKFEATLRLKSGELSDTNTMWLTTKDCVLRNGVVYCSAKSVVPIEGTRRSERGDCNHSSQEKPESTISTLRLGLSTVQMRPVDRPAA